MLKKGYNIVCTSWENDADSYNTTTTVVESLQQARFYVEWLKLFESRHDDLRISNCYTSFGNVAYLRKRTTELAEKYSIWFYETNSNDYAKMTDEEFAEMCSERLYDFADASEYYGFRVVESVSVYYSDHDIEEIDVMADTK